MARERYRLKLKRLDFISAVDAGAQGPIANVALIKRADPGGFEATFRVAKTDESLGLVFGWAMAGTLDGGKSPHVDLQDDAIDVNSNEFLKVCAEFMEGGAAADVNHDGEQDGRVVFAFPLIPEINKALGIETSTHGLAIAMKPSAETFKRFQSGELAAFSIGGVGERTPLAKSTRILKASLFTDEIDGHAHKICVYDDGSLYVEWATMLGATQGHSHGIVRGEDGTLAILADSGHTHALAAGQPGLVVVPADAIVVVSDAAVAMRAPTTNRVTLNRDAIESSLFAQSRNVTSHTEQSMTTKANETDATAEKLSQLEKRNTHLERIAKLSGAHKAHYDTLAVDAQEQFLAKNEIERDQAIEAAVKADPVEFALDGVEYRKSTQGFALAKRLRDEVEKNERAEIAKRATEVLGGASDVQFAIVKAIDSIKDDAARDAATKYIKGLVATSRIDKAAPGFDGATAAQATGGTPHQQLEKGLVAFCKANSIDLATKWSVGLPRFEATEEGASLKRAYDESRAG